MMQDLALAVDQSAGQPSTTRVGIITSVAPVTVELDEQPLNPAVVGCVASYSPRVGDNVVLLGQAIEGADTSASSWTMVGANVNSGAGALSHNGIQIMASVQSNNTGVFQNIIGLTFTYTKRRAGSLIHGRLAGSAFSTVAAAGGEFAARITDTDGVLVTEKVLASHFYNDALKHLGWSGFDDIPNIPAGTYTVQGRFRLYIGAASISFDTNDRLSLYFDEV